MVIIATLVLTLASAFLMGKSMIMGLLPVGAFVGLFGFVVLYNQMELATVMIVVVSLVMQEGVSTGTATKLTFTFLVLAAISAVWIFQLAFVKSKREIRRSPANVPAVIFIIVVIISLIWSSVFVDYAVSYRYAENIKPRLMSTVAFILSPMAYLLYANLVRSDKAIRFFVGSYIAISGLIILLRLFSTVPPILNDDGQIAIWCAALAGGQLLFNHKIKWWMSLALLAVVGLWTYNQFGLGITWLSGWLPLGASLALLVFLRSWKLFMLGVAVLAVVLVLNLDFVNETLNAENDESGHTRTDAWQVVIDLTTDHLLFGVGPTGYAPYLWTYVGDFMATHNNYLDMFAQLGVVGMFIFVWFWSSILWLAWRTFVIAPRTGFYYGLSAALLATVSATLIVAALGDWVIPFAYTQGIAGIDYTIWPWMLAGLTVSVNHHVRGLAARQAEPSSLAALPDTLPTPVTT
jgi:O-antigen ligase